MWVSNEKKRFRDFQFPESFSLYKESHEEDREKKEWNRVQIKEAFCDGTLLSAEGGRQAHLKRSEIEKLTLEKVHEINIILN